MYDKIILVVVGIVMILGGIYGNGHIASALYETQTTDAEGLSDLGPLPDASYHGAAIVTGLLVGFGAGLIIFAFIKNIMFISILASLIGIIIAVLYWSGRSLV